MLRSLARTRAASVALSAVVMAGGALALAACDPLPPCSRTWTGAGGNTNFSNPANWTGNAVPGPTDRACADPGSTIVVNAPVTVESYFLDGTVTIPVGSSLTNTSPTSSMALIDTLNLQGTLSGNSPVITRGATVSGRLTGSSFVVLLGNKPVLVDGPTVDDAKNLLTVNNATFGGDVHLCGGAGLGFMGPTTISSQLVIDTVGCATSTTPAFGVYETGSLAINADIVAPDISYGSMGAVTVAPGRTLSAKSVTQIKGTTALGTDAVVSPADGMYTLTEGTLSGTGTIAGSVTGGGILSPGTNHAGVMNIQGSYLPTAGAVLQYQVAGTTPGTDFAQLTTTSADITSAAISVSSLPGFAPVTGDALTLVQAAGIGGTFASSTLPVVPGHGVTTTVGVSQIDLLVTDCDSATYYPGAVLNGANLSGKNLTGCNLAGAQLYTANLSNTKLANANLSGARMGFANLTGATITGANLSNAINLVTAGGLLSTLDNGWTRTNLSGTGINLTNQNLTAHGTAMNQANLSGANLTGATLAFADLTGAVLQNTNLSGAHLQNAGIEQINLGNANLTTADLSSSVGTPSVSLPATYNATTCPTGVSSDANGGNCEGQWNGGGGGGADPAVTLTKK